MFGSWVSKVLCLIPDSFPSLGLSHKITWLMHEKLFRSCSYPFGPWSALNTPCYLCGWASSLSALNLLLLSEEELVHHCHHVSVQMNKMFCCCMLSVQPLLSVLCRVQVWWGMYNSWALYWVSTDVCIASMDTRVSKGSCSLAAAQP